MMRDAADEFLMTRTPDEAGLRRVLAISIAIHALVVVAVALAPEGWLTTAPPPREVMVISLAGSEGPRSTGSAPIAGKRVDQAVEKPKPAPPPPTPPPPQAKPAPQVPVAAPKPATPAAATKPAAVTPPPAAPVSTGAKVQTGSAVADTGSAGTNQGLSFGGGGTGDAVDLNTFNPEWVAKFRQAIDRVWQQQQGETGVVTLRFTVRRDGSIVEGIRAQVVQNTGSVVLANASIRALINARLPPLPEDYTRPEMVIRLEFKYAR
jgi:protein TonB